MTITIFKGKEYEDTGWVVKTSYDIIGRSSAASIPSVASTQDCDRICELVPRKKYYNV